MHRYVEQTQAHLESATEEDRRLASELAEREETSRSATQTARALEDELAQVRAMIADAALQRDRRIRERVYQEEQIETLTRRRAEIEKEVEALSARLIIVESELERLRQAEAKLSTDNEQAIIALRSAEDSHARKLSEVARAEHEIETSRVELLTHTAAVERLNELARQLENARENAPLWQRRARDQSE
jgi:chromosome segregation ATPase